MALAHSPSVVTNGLVFYYDMNNYKKSWNGAPTTNLVGDSMSIYNNVPGDVSASLVTTGEYYRSAPIYKLTLTPTTASGVSYLTGGNNPGIGVVTGGGGGTANRYTGHAIFYRPTVSMTSTPLYTNYSNIPGWGAGSLGSNRSVDMGDGWYRGEVLWYDTVTRSDGKYWAINPAGATLNVPIHIFWAGPFKEDRNDSAFVAPYTPNVRYANSNLESSPSYPTWNQNAGSTASGGTLTFTSGSYNSKSGWDLYKTYSGLSTGTNYTWSALVKLGTASNLIITMNNTQAWNTGPSTVVAGLSSTDWTRVAITGTTNSGSFNLHLGASNNTEVASTVQSGGTVFIQDVRLVLSQSQTAIADMMDKNTINASSLTYNSDGTFSFNGSNLAIASASPNFNLPGNFTVDGWVKITSYSGTAWELGYYYNGILFRPWNSDDLYINGTNYGNISQYIGLNTWKHFCLTRIGTSCNLYINGNSVWSDTISGTINSNSDALYIGRSSHTSGQFFTGSLNTLRVYKGTGFTQNEVIQNFQAQRGLYGV